MDEKDVAKVKGRSNEDFNCYQPRACGIVVVTDYENCVKDRNRVRNVDEDDPADRHDDCDPKEVVVPDHKDSIVDRDNQHRVVHDQHPAVAKEGRADL